MNRVLLGSFQLRQEDTSGKQYKEKQYMNFFIKIIIKINSEVFTENMQIFRPIGSFQSTLKQLHQALSAALKP